MDWIDDFAEGTFALYAGNTLDGFQPIDFFHFYPLFYDLWIEESVAVIEELGLQDKSYGEVKDLLPPPSNMLALIQKTIPSYQRFETNNKEEIRTFVNFFARMLVESVPDDPFKKNSNRLVLDKEPRDIVEEMKLDTADLEKARMAGRFITAAGSLVHGYYNDIATDYGWDVFGPYDVGNKSFLIRYFKDMQPEGIGWESEDLLSVKEIKMYNTYEDVEWEILSVGCHTIAKSGSPVEGMREYAIYADGKKLSDDEIVSLIDEMSDKAEIVYQKIRAMNFEELKSMVLYQEMYQLSNLFSAAGKDWRPSEEMIARVKNKELVDQFLPKDEFMNTIEEYKEIFGINLFKKEVLS